MDQNPENSVNSSNGSNDPPPAAAAAEVDALAEPVAEPSQEPVADEPPINGPAEAPAINGIPGTSDDDDVPVPVIQRRPTARRQRNRVQMVQIILERLPGTVSDERINPRKRRRVHNRDVMRARPGVGRRDRNISDDDLAMPGPSGMCTRSRNAPLRPRKPSSSDSD